MNFPFFKKNKDIVQNNFYFGLLLKEDKANCFVIKKNNLNFTIVDEVLITYSNGWESLTEDVDEALTLMEQRNKISLKSTIIFIYSHFIDEANGKIKTVYFDKIKSLLKNLELKPLGYIECYEGIINTLNQKEGIIVNTLLLELDLTQLTLFIFKNGKKVFMTIVPRTENVVNDILTALGKLKEKILLPSRLLLYNSGNLSSEAAEIIGYHWTENYFIQPPKVEVVKQEDLKQYLINVFKKQVIDEERPVIEETVIEEKNQPATEVMGFKIGEDVAVKSVETGHAPSVQNKHLLKIKFPKITMSFSNWQKKITLIGGLLLIVGAVVANEYFFHKTELTVYLPSQKIEKAISLNKDELRIATFSGDVKLSQVTTGKKDIGEKARGEVTVYNYEDQQKTFSKGTIVTLDNLKYVFDTDIKIDASKIADDMAKLPGKNKVQISAAEIGPEYNLEKGKKLKVADTSFLAINESALIGGSKKTIKTVAKKDLDDLKTEALKKTKEDQDILIKLQTGEKAISELTEAGLDEVKYSKEVGEEGDNISLTASNLVTVYYYQEKEMLKLLQEKIADTINSGYKLTLDQIKFEVTKVDKTIDLNLTAKAIKEVDKKAVEKDIIFKNQDQLDKILKNNFSATSFILKIKEPLPVLNNFTSPFAQNNAILLIGN